VASNVAYDDGFQNGDNGGTGFGAWSISTVGTSAGQYIASSTSDGFGDINTSGESFGLYADNGTSGVYCSRSLNKNLPVGKAFSIILATKWRDGNRGVNIFDSTGTFLINFKVDAANGGKYFWNGSQLPEGSGQIGEYSDTARWKVVGKQTGASSIEFTLERLDKSITSSVVPKTGVIRSFQVFNEFENTSSNNNLYFNSMVVATY
jgi:hypothetical protein